MSDYPLNDAYNAVCYITAVSGGKTWQGSGVIIGPHTVLTASHVLWDSAAQLPMTDVRVYPGYAQGGSYVPGAWQVHFNQVGNTDRTIGQADAQQDFAVINFAVDLSAYHPFALATAEEGGVVHVSGYPVSNSGNQSAQTGLVSIDTKYSTFNYETIIPSAGASGGPIWVNEDTPGGKIPTVIGVISSTKWAAEVTSESLKKISDWQDTDTYLWKAQAPLAASVADLARAVFRFFDTRTGDHFYTTNTAEKLQIEKTLPWFTYEGTPWAAPAKGADTVDVFRFFDTASNAHFFTTSVAERDQVLKTAPTYKYEGVAFEAYADAGAPGGLTLERFYNTQTGQHHFAGSAEEANGINHGAAGPGWVDEGKAFTVHVPTDTMIFA